MKKVFLLNFCVILFCSFLTAQAVTENTEKPSSENAGRVVELVELMRIDDVGGDFYFKYPRNPKVSPDGSLFVQDYD